VNISGGEPTKYSKFINLIKYLDHIELPYYLTSNGLFSLKKYNLIKKSKMLLAFKISLDGTNPQSHLYIRDPIKKNKKIYNNTLKTLNQLKKDEIYTIVGTLIHSKNYKEILEFPKFLNKLNVKKWIIGPLLSKGRGKNNNKNINSNEIIKLFKDKKFIKKLNKECIINNIELDLSDFKTLDKKDYYFKCGAGIHYYHISTYLIAYPCPLLPYTRFAKNYSYKIKNNLNNINKIWNSIQFKNWRIQQIKGCPDCKL
ncbi:MAG: radical SAM protein, partial [Candidatus ainarchaeum sp.]|nr:radical SAM protein [Candidatus ainarchaeum sp.]